MPLDDLKRRATDLALKYNSDLDAPEFVCEIESFKYQAMEIFENLGNMDTFEILQKKKKKEKKKRKKNCHYKTHMQL
jgi:hypothetical protein